MTTALVVEDDPGILRLVAAELRDIGYETLPTPDAETALELLGDGASVDVAVVDVRLPGMSGLELVHRMRERDDLRSCRILLISAHGEPKTHRADAFLSKPFDVDQLVQSLGHVPPSTGQTRP